MPVESTPAQTPPQVIRRRFPPLVWVTFAAIAGILLAEYWSVAARPFFWSLAVLAGAAWFLRRQGLAGLLVFCAAAYGFIHAMTGDTLQRFPLRPALEAGATMPVTVTGLVLETPLLRGKSTRFPVEIESLETGSQTFFTCGRILVKLPADAAPPRYGDRVRILGTLRKPEGARNPGQFDSADWLRRQGIAAEVQATLGGGCTVLESGRGNPLKALACRSRDWIAATVTAELEDAPAEAAAVKAMVLGTQEQIPEEIDLAFLNSGTLHVFSVSGLHVGLVALILWQVLRALGCGRRTAAALSIPLIFFYALLTGWQSSAVRSAVMAGLALGGLLVDRPASMTGNLAAAALVVLAWDTQQLFSAGCQLSFGTLIALSCLSQPMIRAFRRLYSPDDFLPRELLTNRQEWLYGARKWIVSSMCISLAAGIGSAPLTLWHFQLATPVALVANLVLIVLAGFILSTAFASMVAGLCSWHGLSHVLNHANWAFARASIWFATAFSHWPGAYVKWNLRTLGETPVDRVTVYDAGEGAAVEFTPQQGQAWLFDTGDPFRYRAVTSPGLGFHGLAGVSGLLLSHGDHEHVGAAPEAIPGLRPDQIIAPPGRFRSPMFRAALETAQSRGVSVRQLGTGDVLDLDGGATLRVLFPPRDWTASLADDRALVWKIEQDGWRLLFVSDAGFTTESWLLASGQDLRADVLIKGRHAGDVSGLPDFLDAVQPGLAICTNVPFPSEEQLPPAWVADARSRGLVIFDQLATGAVTLRLTPGRLEAVPFLGQRPWVREK